MGEVNIPFGLADWIAEHAGDFAPPVANKEVWPGSEFVFMVVRGPNARNDFHLDPGDEIFYQLRGTIRVDLIEPDGERTENLLHEGQVMLVPAGTPHAPLRPADTWGLVIERPRHPDEIDRIRWYCDACGAVVHEAAFHVADIEVQLKAALEAFNSDTDLRTCPACATVVPVAEPFVL